MLNIQERQRKSILFRAGRMLAHPENAKDGRRSALVAIATILTGCSAGTSRPNSAKESTATFIPRATDTPFQTETPTSQPATAKPTRRRWKYSSIDTMKDSRDRARGMSQTEIDLLVEEVAASGATHIAIDTPYDEVFFPFLKQWVDAVRSKKLSIIFRGNFCAWEGWFTDYGFAPTMTPDEHIAATKAFISKHRDIFLEGDIFMPAPEPENVLLKRGDPRNKGNQALYDFVTKEYAASMNEFINNGIQDIEIGFSMNVNVAAQLPSEVVTQLGNKVIIDHEVADPKAMGEKIAQLQNQYPGVQILIGEFGAPVPGINADMTPRDQAAFIQELLDQIAQGSILGLNYWVLHGLPTDTSALLNPDETRRPAYDVIKNAYQENRRLQ